MLWITLFFLVSLSLSFLLLLLYWLQGTTAPLMIRLSLSLFLLIIIRLSGTCGSWLFLLSLPGGINSILSTRRGGGANARPDSSVPCLCPALIHLLLPSPVFSHINGCLVLWFWVSNSSKSLIFSHTEYRSSPYQTKRIAKQDFGQCPRKNRFMIYVIITSLSICPVVCFQSTIPSLAYKCRLPTY